MNQEEEEESEEEVRRVGTTIKRIGRRRNFTISPVAPIQSRAPLWDHPLDKNLHHLKIIQFPTCCVRESMTTKWGQIDRKSK